MYGKRYYYLINLSATSWSSVKSKNIKCSPRNLKTNKLSCQNTSFTHMDGLIYIIEIKYLEVHTVFGFGTVLDI